MRTFTPKLHAKEFAYNLKNVLTSKTFIKKTPQIFFYSKNFFYLCCVNQK